MGGKRERIHLVNGFPIRIDPFFLSFCNVMAPGRQRLAPCTVWTTRVMDRILTLAANLFLITGRPTKTKQNKRKCYRS